MENRKKDSYSTFMYDFICKDIDIKCPACGAKAIVKSVEKPFDSKERKKIKCSCISCGYNKTMGEKKSPILLGTNKDPFFHNDLWHRGDFGSHEIWAYNREHLLFVRAHVAAFLRERSRTETKNHSIGSRLPKWMCAGKNREAILKIIAEMLEKK